MQVDYSTLALPACPTHASCEGFLKPGVVLFGENVPKPRVDSAMSSLLASDALLILGTSVQVRIPKCSYDFQLPRRCSCR